jgi:hypothetical protein
MVDGVVGPRHALKAERDLQQARAAAAIATHYLRLPFDPQPLSALPTELRKLTAEVLLDEPDGVSSSGLEPKW